MIKMRWLKNKEEVLLENLDENRIRLKHVVEQNDEILSVYKKISRQLAELVEIEKDKQQSLAAIAIKLISFMDLVEMPRIEKEIKKAKDGEK